MKHAFALLIITVTSLALPPQLNAAAPKLTGEQREILVQIASGAEVTEALHSRFWAPLKTSQDTESLRSTAELLRRRDLVLLVQRYQLEVWACALKSWTKETVIRTKELDDLEAQALEVARQSPGSEPTYRASFANTQRLLQAAAAHSSVTTPQGELKITLDMIANTLEEVEAATKRMTTLLDPVWQPQ
jgi:hypothetical protein